MEVARSQATDDRLTHAANVARPAWAKRHAHRLGSVLALVISLVFLFAALQLEFGSISRPGPGFWPFVVSGLTCLLAIGTGLLSRQDEEGFEREGSQRVAYLLMALLAFPLLFGMIGFVVPSILLIVFMMRVLSRETWIRSVLVAVATTIVTFAIFGLFLDIRLPAFSLGS